MDIISAIGDFINNTQKRVNELAEKTGFKLRKSKLEPKTFVMALTTGQLELHEITLDTIANKCEEIQDGLTVSKQAIHQRMVAGSELMKEVFEKAFADVSSKHTRLESMEILKQFKDIKITDGTTISLPNKLRTYYKGLGGKNSDAAIKLQTTYSVFRHEFVSIDSFSATKNDATYNETLLNSLEPEELSIKDLGYYDGDYFQEIENKRAYFISRIKTNCIFYEKKLDTYVPVDITESFAKRKTCFDRKLFIKLSTGSMFEIRITGLKLPRIVSAERKRKAYKSAKSKKKQLTSREIQLLDWFIVITNVNAEMLTVETIGELYRLRWQIELQFKALKSSMDFNDFGNAGIYYFKCLFYGKMTMILLTMRIFSICRSIKFKETRLFVSVQRFIRNFRNSLNLLSSAVIRPTKKVLDSLEAKILRIAHRSLFDKRISRKTTEEKIKNHDLPNSVLNMLVEGGF